MEIVVHYYHHHIGDFLKATSRLSDAQSMAYLRLLWMYYDSEKPLPDDLDVLAFQVGTDTKTVELILLSFFKPDETGPEKVWTHTRCDREIKEYRQLIHKKRNAGKASAERRSNTSSTGVEQVSNSDPTPVQLTNNQEPVTINHIKDKNARKRASVVERPEEVSEQAWEAFIVQRKSKRSPITEVVMDQIASEAKKADMSLDAALREICMRGWTGFKADWVRVSPNSQPAKRDRKLDLLLGKREPDIVEVIDADYQERLNALSGPSF